MPTAAVQRPVLSRLPQSVTAHTGSLGMLKTPNQIGRNVEYFGHFDRLLSPIFFFPYFS
jgi:hypothetical protein